MEQANQVSYEARGFGVVTETKVVSSALGIDGMTASSTSTLSSTISLVQCLGHGDTTTTITSGKRRNTTTTATGIFQGTSTLVQLPGPPASPLLPDAAPSSPIANDTSSSSSLSLSSSLASCIVTTIKGW
jgi:hypothetical protein